jgi:hypothetical protein
MSNMFNEDPNEFEVDLNDEQFNEIEELDDEIDEPNQEDWDDYNEHLASRQLEEDFWFQQPEDTWG